MEGDLDLLRRCCCQNPRCVAYGSFGAGNLTTSGWVDKGKTIRLLLCRTCGTRFSSRKGTVFFRARLPESEVVSLLNHVQDGCGMRQTGRLTGHKEDTVVRYAKLAGEHARRAHDRLVAFSPADPGGAVRREVGLRRQEAAALRPDGPRRP
jgi:LacI family transcriptional regulator